MNKLNSYLDYNNLIKILNNFYKLNIDEIYLHREMIGFVYFARNKEKKFVLKIYRHFNTKQALQSIKVINYLKKQDYPVVSIVPNEFGNLYFQFNTPDGSCIGILYDYIDGIEPNLKIEITNVGLQIGELHNLMDKYPNQLIRRGKDFYIDRYIEIMKKLNYSSSKIDDLEFYGRELWNNIQKLPNGFCHGDLHSGNMLQIKNQFILYDFDVASYSYSTIDVSTLSNETNFNNLDESTYDSTMRLFEQFYRGYSKKRTLSDIEVKSIFDFIAIRHYELIATITECKSLNGISEAFLEQQYHWLMNWQKLCSRHRN